MIIEQTINIPASRRLHLDFDLPLSVSAGPAKVTLVVADETPDDETAYLLAAGANRERLLSAVEDIKAGKNLVSVPFP